MNVACKIPAASEPIRTSPISPILSAALKNPPISYIPSTTSQKKSPAPHEAERETAKIRILSGASGGRNRSPKPSDRYGWNTLSSIFPLIV